MGVVICFKCSTAKPEPFRECFHCKTAPKAEDELLVSLILSEELSSKAQLATFAALIRRGQKPTFGPDELGAAKSLLLRKTAAAPTGTPKQPLLVRKDAPNATALHRNPFYVLGASTRDNRRRIVELAEEKALSLEPESCGKARSELTNPRNRLAVELAWLPGVAPSRTKSLIDGLRAHVAAVRSLTNTPALAHANLMASAFELLDPEMSSAQWTEWVTTFAHAVEGVDSGEVLKLINEERAVAEIPEVQSVDVLEEQLALRRKGYRDSVKEALSRLPSRKRVEIMTLVADQATEHGTQHAPTLIDELIDSYEVDAQQFLNSERENVLKLVKTAKQSAAHGEQEVLKILTRLDQVVRNWDAVAQPIQLSTKSRGLDHDMSHELARVIRSLAVDLHNEHNMFDATTLLTKVLAEVFAEVPEVAEKVAEDTQALEQLFEERTKAKQEVAEWEREITYKAELGLIFKDTLAISPRGLQWKEALYPLDEVSRVRWGAIRRSTNGIPTGTSYYITFGNSSQISTAETAKAEVFTTFTDKMWRAVCSRLITQMLQGMREGRKYQFADAVVDDKGVELTRSRLFKANERVYGTWGDLNVWVNDGAFWIGHKEDKKVATGLSYLEIDNAHILEAAVRMAFKKGLDRLSDLLR